MPSNYRTISFVSGKGGVGKTSLASNFAWICSRLSKTVLMDLDFQNQGGTGLFLSFVSQGTCGAFEILSGAEEFQKCAPTQVEDNLYFIPSVSILSPPQYALMPALLGSSQLVAKLSEYIRVLREQFSFETVILDCHGGLDYASVAAFQVSSYTIMVTEADAVTFNGTLELLSFYDSEKRTEDAARQDGETFPPEIPQASQSPANPETTVAGHIQFIVNRLPPKYKFEDIQVAYRHLLQSYSGRLSLAGEVLSFIPEENYVAETFGEYPFVVKLAPASIIARKLQLMAFQLLSPVESALQRYRPLRKLRSPRFRRKIERSVISAEGKNTKNIIQAFGLAVTVISMFMVAYFIIVVWLTLGDTENSSGAAISAIFGNVPFITIGALSAVVFLFYAVKAQFGLMFFYRDQYRFRRALLRAMGSRPNVWQRLMLLRLWILRAGNSVLPMFWIVVLAIAFLAVLILR